MLRQMVPEDRDVYFAAAGVASVRWDQKGQLVLVEWEGWADSTEFGALLEAEVSALKEHRGSRLLADCRRQKVLRPDDQRADTEWLPRAIGAGLKRLAIVLPKSGLAATNIRDRFDNAAKATLEIAYFQGLDEARAWLTR
ncbi:MAG: hypothetical protein QOH92_1317 [Chloroflexota bacterium]|jgi:hypothetical protein|nr:hypothetical protein [Chloroflexota bacterium]